MRSIAPAAAVTLIAFAMGALAAGCGGGYDEDEAKAVCDGLIGNVRTAPSGAYAQCVACFMECGDDCAMAESDPPQFLCPE